MNIITNHKKKVVLAGHFGVGKTSLVRRFVHEQFSEVYKTSIGVKVDKKLVTLESAEVTMMIWDIEGREYLESLPKSYFIGTSGIIYVFDLARPSTYANVGNELDVLDDFSPGTEIVLAANKCDLLADLEIKGVMKLLPMACDCVTSAKTGEKVQEMFVQLGEKMIR